MKLTSFAWIQHNCHVTLDDTLTVHWHAVSLANMFKINSPMRKNKKITRQWLLIGGQNQFLFENEI